jgi:hypothetical protein
MTDPSSPVIPEGLPKLAVDAEPPADVPSPSPVQPEEIGGPKGPDPTRFGDWERKGRCIDF